MSETAIKIENLSKIYKLYDKPIDRMKESLHPFRKTYHKDFFALKDIAIKIDKGESIGIIGRNGSGKSTLLKILTGVLSPSFGSVEVLGKISALLELGSGFNPEFTGVENLYFNGSIMGYTREEMTKRIDDILQYADIGDFAFQPVKVYSSGMFVRLAFSLAINVDPEIFIVDEALSVGDIFFQQKCMNTMKTRFEKVTKIYVSHDLQSVIALCDRVIVMEKGKVIFNGEPDEAVKLYSKILYDTNGDGISGGVKHDCIPATTDYLKYNWLDVSAENLCGSGKIKISKVSITDAEWKTVSIVEPDSRVFLNMIADSELESDLIIAGYIVHDRVGNSVFSETSRSLKKQITMVNGRYMIRYEIKWPKIRPGFYTITLGLGEGVVVQNNFVHSWAQNCIAVENINQNSTLAMFDHDINNMTIEKLR